jgi:cytochrome c oxidase assembly factor CtaG
VVWVGIAAVIGVLIGSTTGDCASGRSRIMANFFLNAWSIDPIFLLSLAAIAAGYAKLAPRLTRATLVFAAGMAVWLLAEVSPLDTLGSQYLLSAHMLQHLVLAQIAPPLLLLGAANVFTTTSARRPTTIEVAAGHRSSVARRPSSILTWLIGIGTLWFWHAPPIYNAAASDTLRAVQHLTVLLGGLAFWWPVFAPNAEVRMSGPSTVLYLASACLASTVLGMLLFFAPSVLYQGYLNTPDAYSLRYFCTQLGLTPQVDQQLAGLMMWVPCCLLYLSTIAFSLLRWYSTPEYALTQN